jgi:hypothetical protein
METLAMLLRTPQAGPASSIKSPPQVFDDTQPVPADGAMRSSARPANPPGAL